MIYGECVTDECGAERNWPGKFSSVTDWSTAGGQGKLVFVVSTEPSLAQFVSLFTAGKKSTFDRLNYTSIQVFHFKISVKKKPSGAFNCTLRSALANIRTVRGGFMKKLAYMKRGPVWFYNFFFLFQRNVFIVVGSNKWYTISSFWKPNILYVAI